MSLYREPGRERRRRRVTVAAVATGAIALAAVVAILIAGGDDTPSAGERARESSDAAAKVLDGLELLEIEYGQAVKDGRVVAPTEYQAAQADVKRAIDAFADVDGQADPAVRARVRTTLAALEGAVQRRAAAAELKALIGRARSDVETLTGG